MNLALKFFWSFFEDFLKILKFFWSFFWCFFEVQIWLRSLFKVCFEACFEVRVRLWSFLNVGWSLCFDKIIILLYQWYCNFEQDTSLAIMPRGMPYLRNQNQNPSAKNIDMMQAFPYSKQWGKLEPGLKMFFKIPFAWRADFLKVWSKT